MKLHIIIWITVTIAFQVGWYSSNKIGDIECKNEYYKSLERQETRMQEFAR